MSSNERLEVFLSALESEIVNKYACYAIQFFYNHLQLEGSMRGNNERYPLHIEGCASCEYQCASKLNYNFAIKCAWEYINIPYLRVPQDIRRELLYSLSLRHVNQETLALVFDIISQYNKS